jgi:hypothetical protein
MPLDISLWKLILNKMRAVEDSWGPGRSETVDQYRARLETTARGLTETEVSASLGLVAKHARTLAQQKGAHIKEGGRRKRKAAAGGGQAAKRPRGGA